MLVPATRLLLVTGAIGVPAAILAILPGGAAIGYGVIGVLAAIAAFDALAARSRLRGIDVRTDPVVRLWKDRESGIDLTIRNQRQAQMTLRIGLPLPEEITTPQEDLPLVLPEGSEFSRIAFACQPRKRGQFFIASCAL